MSSQLGSTDVVAVPLEERRRYGTIAQKPAFGGLLC